MVFGIVGVRGPPVASLAEQVDEVDRVPAKNPNLEELIVWEMTLNPKIAIWECSAQVTQS